MEININQMRCYHQKSLVLILLISLSFSLVNAQDEKELYEKKFTIQLGMGPCMLAIDQGIQMQNQFTLELSKLFSLSATLGTALAYNGMDDVQRLYLGNIEISPDDYIRQQSLIFTNLGMQISPINSKHHRLFIGMGPSLNLYNSTVGEVIMHGDSTAFVLINRNSETISFNFFGGYDLSLGDHIVVGTSVYYSKFTEDIYSILFSAGYRF